MPKVARTPAAEEAAPAKKRRKETRAADGDGGLYFDAKAGLWRGELMVGWKPSAKDPKKRVRDRRKVAAKTQAEARKKLQELRQQHSTGDLREPNRQTVETFFTDWLENTVKPRRRLSTYTQYRSLITVHAIPRLGSKPLPEVRTKHIDDMYRALEAGTSSPSYQQKDGKALTGRRSTRPGGLAPKSIRSLHVALRSGFERAVRLSLIHKNPADGAELPSAPRRRKLPVDLADVQQLLTHAQATDSRWWPLWTFLTNTGLRIGEALALRWANVDLDAGWFTVAEGMDRAGNVGETKTETGEREVPLTRQAVDALRHQHDRQQFERRALGADYDDRDLVFATQLGTPLDERKLLNHIKRAAKLAGLTETKSQAICLHDLRRITASVLVSKKVDIVTAAAIIGHKNASVLLDVYAQALRDPKRAAAGALEAAFYGERAALPR